MAQAVTISMVTAGIQLSQSPIVFSFQVASNNTDTVQDLNQAIRLTTYHGKRGEKDTDYSNLDLISSIDILCDNQTFNVDVSEAVRGWFIQKDYDCSSLENLKGSVATEEFTMTVLYKCRRLYKEDGSYAYYEEESPQECTFQVLEGGLTEYSVYNYGATCRDDFAETMRFSLKPFEMETVNFGEIPYPECGRTYYAETERNPFRRRFFFLNSCGLLESASLLCREEKDIKYSTGTHKLYKGASFSYTPIVAASKTSSTSWKMSSGYCTKAWCDWWAGEFAFAKRFWMEMEDGSLEPVTINVENVTSYNKAKGTLGSVNFTVKSGIY